MTRLLEVLVGGNLIIICFNLWLLHRVRQLHLFYRRLIADVMRVYELEKSEEKHDESHAQA